MRFWSVVLLFGLGLSLKVSAAPALSCMSGGAEVCIGADNKFSSIGDDEFERAFDIRQEKFVNWMKPLSFYVQSLTGLPMTIVTAQAALASDWGTSPAFVKHKNIFKMTCWQPKAVISGEVRIGTHKLTYKAKCSTDKAAGQIGKIMTFQTREESLYAYLDMILESHAKIYKPVQEHLKHAQTTVPPRPPSYRGISPMMAAFSHDSNYVAALKRAVELNKMVETEASQCWICMRDQMGAPK